ncbi:LysM peptidoglycan-binding domain-containing protein [Mesobacillus harenae]|uniref:LysM peptidoglycan-binding domain-containing protein n=1 Tax=Mesobacillus harenae TaxID=2213203 RepID=UPI00158108DA|nr:LysM peptidoglycan-binding domain-containing protein [Mesobacillus harenae]
MKKIRQFVLFAVSTVLVVSLFFFANGFGYAAGDSIIIKKGDTLYSISKQYNISVQELKEHNDLKNNTIKVGQKLLLPGLKQTDPLYVVMAGSFAKKMNADKQISLLKKKGIEAVAVKRVITNQIYYRIQTGVFSDKKNAEKQREVLRKQGIKDSYILTDKPLHINDVTVGSMSSQLEKQFGKPAKIEDYMNIRSFYYKKQGAGVRVNFNMNDGSIFGLQVYPEFLNSDAIPKQKSKVLDVYGYPNEVTKISCYESASCEQFIYKFNKSKLVVQFDRDGKTVQYLDLSKLQ